MVKTGRPFFLFRIPATHLTILLALLTIYLLGAISEPVCAAAPAKRARRPKFTKSITDVFFTDARDKLVGPRPKWADNEAASPDNPPADAASSGPADKTWPKLISSDAIEDEIKTQQTKLAEAVQNPTKFKGGEYRQARLALSALATLFAIDAQFGEKMRWQREAAGVRDHLARAGFNCKVGTDNSYREAKSRSEELQTLVRGGAIEVPAATAEAAWAKVADRSPLMQRLEQAQQQGLAVWTANAGEFARHSDKLEHEAQIVAALAEVIAGEGYEFSDDETYREYANAMRGEALAAREAVSQKNYEQARQAVAAIGKACANCHEGFRN